MVLSLFLVAIMASCAKETPKIGFSVGDFSSDRWSQEPQIFQEEATSLGAEVLFEYAYGDANKQLEQAKKLIDSGIQVLIVFPTNAGDWKEVVEAAHKQGVQVIAYDRMLQNANVDYYFSFDNDDVGRQQAQYAVNIRPKGNYILLGGPTSDINSLHYMQGQKEILKPYIDRGDIKIVLEKHLATWNSIDAYNEIQAFLENNKIKVDAILAANDELASGSIMAIDMALGSSDIVITGQDASVGGCQNILDGKQSMTVYKSIRNLAKAVAQAGVRLAKGEKINNVTTALSDGTKDIPSVFLKVLPVDKNNLKETVIADGFLKADQLKFAP